MSKQYVLNLETNKIELQFSKSEYQSLSDADKKQLKSSYLFSGSRSAWVSRSSSNHYYAIQTAKKLGFEDGGRIGERLSYAEQVERKQEKAEARAERYEQYAENADKRAEGLQAGWKEASKDWSFVTQPNINSSKGRSFTNYRNKIMERYNKGFEEYRKGEYFRDKAMTAQETASMEKYKDKTYLNNRIEESNKTIRELERRIVQAEEKENEEWLTRLLERMEIEMDKLAYMLNCMDAIGGVQYNKDNVKSGYLVKIRGRWNIVLKANPKSVDVKSISTDMGLRYPYAEIQELKIPEDWKEEKKEAINPFNVGDIVVSSAYSAHNGFFEIGKNIYKAFQVIKKTEKGVTVQQIAIIDNIPQPDNFISSSQDRRSIKINSKGISVINHDWYLYKYNSPVTV